MANVRPPRPRRVNAMLDQLTQTADEYVTAKAEYDAARVAYEVAQEKFASVRRIAVNVLTPVDWAGWRQAHKNVEFTGLKIGEAVVEALRANAFESAMAHWDSQGKTRFFPQMTLGMLLEVMERGGYEFRTTAPLREVNAALINLDGVTKVGDHFYKHAKADEMLEALNPDSVPF